MINTMKKRPMKSPTTRPFGIVDTRMGLTPRPVRLNVMKATRTALPSTYKKGGRVKKTGYAKVHKGERVLTKRQAKRFNAGAFERARRGHFRIGKKKGG